MLPAHLSDVIHKDPSIGVAHSDCSTRIIPSDPVEGRVTLYCNAGSGNLKQ